MPVRDDDVFDLSAGSRTPRLAVRCFQGPPHPSQDLSRARSAQSPALVVMRYELNVVETHVVDVVEELFEWLHQRAEPAAKALNPGPHGALLFQLWAFATGASSRRPTTTALARSFLISDLILLRDYALMVRTPSATRLARRCRAFARSRRCSGVPTVLAAQAGPEGSIIAGLPASSINRSTPAGD